MGRHEHYNVLFIAPYPALVEQARLVVSQYPELAVTIHEGDLSQGLASALSSMDANFDVIISRGGTAQLLEDEFALPVIEVGISVSDLYKSLVTHNPDGNRTAVVGFENVIGSLREVANFSDFSLDLYGVTFEDELPLVLQTVLEGRYPVVLCDTFSLPKCRELGLNAFLLESNESSVSAAFTEALGFCQRSHELLSKNRMLWNLVRTQDARFAVFSTDGKITYSNLEESRDDLVAFMRSHIMGRVEERLVLQRGRRTFHIHKVPVESDGERFSAFSVIASNSPSSANHVGIERSNRSDIEASYQGSTFHKTRASEVLSPLVTGVRGTSRPLLLMGEPCSGKAQVAQLLYLTSSSNTKPFVAVNCPLVTEKSWSYLADSPSSPLYSDECTIFFNSLQSLGESRTFRLLDVIRRAGIVERDRLIFSLENTDALAPKLVELLYESLHFSTVRIPALRERADLGRAITLLLNSICEEKGMPRPVLTDEALDLLEHHSWPGNYEELTIVLQQCVTETSEGSVDSSTVRSIIGKQPGSIGTREGRAGIEIMRPLREVEKDIVREVVKRSGGNQTEAARILGVSRTTIWRLLG